MEDEPTAEAKAAVAGAAANGESPNGSVIGCWGWRFSCAGHHRPLLRLRDRASLEGLLRQPEKWATARRSLRYPAG